MSDPASTAADPFKIALAAAQRANEQGDWVVMEAELRKCLALQPANGVITGHLGLALSRQGRPQEAIPVLEKALTLGAHASAILALADEYEKGGRLTDAWKFYKLYLRNEPKNAYALVQLGGVRERLGDAPGARGSYRLAYESAPDDINVTHKYTNALWAQDPETALRLTERLLTVYKDQPLALSTVLSHVICQKEWYERIKRGLMPYHCSRVDELFFVHAQDYVEQLATVNAQLLAARPNDPLMKLGLAAARFALKDRHGAEALIRGVGEKLKGHIYGAVRFAPEYYDELRAMPDADLTRGLPPQVEMTALCPDPKGVLYLSCNYTYFQAFALPMIVSLRERSPGTPVHVHIMDADEQQTAFAHEMLRQLAPLKFALSIEKTGLKKNSMEARCYYHAVRFIRFYEHLLRYGCPLWLMDVDAIVHRDLGELFETLGENDAAMRIRPGRLEPWNQFNACIVGASQSPVSKEYFRLIAAYMAHFYQRNGLRWGIDQLAMYGVFADMQDRGGAPTLALLGEREVDYNYLDDGFVWCNSGAGKFRHLQRISQPNSMPLANFEENKFVIEFDKLWTECQNIANSIVVPAGKTGA